MDLVEVGQEGEGGLVAQRHVDQAMVSEGAHGSNGGRFLATAESTGGDEDTGMLTPVATGGPDRAGLVPEGLPLRGEVTVASGDTEQDRVVLEQVVRLDNGVARLGGGVHLDQNIVGEGLGDPSEAVSNTLFNKWNSLGMYWKMSAFPPADSMPFFSASANFWIWPYSEYWKLVSACEDLEGAKDGRTKTIATLGAMMNDVF